eukprot:COSAG02_NODE_2406_length_8930_cov_10.414676_9_plen_91_part_00
MAQATRARRDILSIDIDARETTARRAGGARCASSGARLLVAAIAAVLLRARHRGSLAAANMPVGVCSTLLLLAKDRVGDTGHASAGTSQQ